ncbi:TPA: hypothetical protein ACKP7D_000966 [Serratia marcescens]
MEKFDREFQLHLLTVCAAAYPENAMASSFDKETIINAGNQKIFANIHYLHEHELIVLEEQRSDDPYYILDYVRATKNGIDFLLNDGGLSAILNVQTVRFHNDTIMAIEDLLSLSGLPEPEKASIVSRLRELPADAIKHLTNELITKAVVATPAVIHLIQTALQ